MNILVTGANGQLGNEMRILAAQGNPKSPFKGDLEGLSTANFIFTDVNQVEGVETTYLDITDLDAIRQMVAQHSIQAIVNCAAWTNVDAAEDPEKYGLVKKLNATAPENIAIAMKEVGGLLVHISTDYVFGSEPYNTPCKEDQTGTPTGVYGQTKLLGEQNIVRVFEGKSSPSEGDGRGAYVIIRTAWLYSEFGKNFCKTMMNLTAAKPELKVVFDQVGTPTYAMDLAKAIVTILDDWKNVSSPFKGDREGLSAYTKSGIYHYSNEGVCSWYDFTKMIQQISEDLDVQGSPNSPSEGELEARCNVQPCYSSDFPSPVKRPSYSVLDKSKIKTVFGVVVPYWTDSLKQCISNLKK